ncbi:MAG TPA: HAD-IIIC family phosphatase [Sedimentisphaerales bacterium]|nr:HAD-IIIC family phosphatase [Sedimentisphaerales bacterium]
MKPFLCFLGGCEFEYIIVELKSNPAKYFDFDYFHTFEHCAETNPYTFLADHAEEVLRRRPDAFILSQHDFMMGAITKIQLNWVVSKDQQDAQLRELIDQAELMIIVLSELNVPIIMQFFPWFRTNMLNRFKHTGETYNEEQFMRKYVTAMEELTVKYPNFYFMNLTNVCSMHGFKQTLKQKDAPWYSHIAFGAAHIAQEYTHLFNYVLQQDKKVKCVIVDLDNTMWKGVIRDVGVENLEIRIDRERFHWTVLAILHARGILIGVISKNDPHLAEDIRNFIKPHLAGIEFVCFTLNWRDKWENLLDVQKQLNIGLDSIAFIDDQPFEREQMKAMLPEVRVYDENIFEQLLYLPEFQPQIITRESRKRARYYAQEGRRNEARGNLAKEEFLEQCRFKIEVKKMRPYEVDRVTELIQRTNQLNTSIKRYTKQQIISFGHREDCEIFTVNVSDKFGDYGLVGVCVAFGRGNVYEIDTLLFSCRVMSKGVEDYTVTSVLNHARAANFDKAVLRFKKGPKNDQMRTILSNNNFVEAEADDESVVFSFDLRAQQIKPVPKWLTPTKRDAEAAGALVT